ncbi:MAG: hypothetical protein EXS15_08185 [Phycisphaerales bacterium]|nr:hypothetical protein [Phycisphaerales bacterium]
MNLSTHILGNACFTLALVLGATGCGDADLMPAGRTNAVPSAGANTHTVAVLRVDLAHASVEQVFDAIESGLTPRTIGATAARPDEVAKRKLSMLRDGLTGIGATTIVAFVPGDATFIDDMGFYIGATADMDPELIEDEFVRAGGVSGMLVTNMLAVTSLGQGWYFVGVSGDGRIEGASESRANEFAKALEQCDDLPLAAAALADWTPPAWVEEVSASSHGESADVMSHLPRLNGRLMRRLDALGASLKSVWAFNAGLDHDRVVVAMVFEDDGAATDFESALTRIKKDIELARDGGLRSGEISASDDHAISKWIAAVSISRIGPHVRLSHALVP